MSVKPVDPEIVESIRHRIDSDAYAAYLRNTLLELAAINTAPSRDLAATVRGERILLELLEREIHEIDGQARCERCPIDPAIADDPAYAPPGYAADDAGKVPPFDSIYKDRCNLVVSVPGADPDQPPGVILHAHLDVVSPWYAPRSAGERVFGRGVCDDKSHLAVVLGQIKLLREIRERRGYRPARGFAVHLVIDEEIGGNGSLSLARDPRFAGIPVLMLEPTDLVPRCAHRGAVYYRCWLSVGSASDRTAVEMFPFVVAELEELGRAVRQETRDPIFSAEHVQMNHGVLGPYGRHAGNVCDHVAVELEVESKANPHRIAMIMVQIMEETMGAYTRLYGDATRRMDPGTGEPLVRRHFDLQIQPASDTQKFRLDVWGKAGHMGALSHCDNAITKAAYLLGSLIRMSPKFPNVRARGVFPDSAGDDRRIVLEGGLGFAPTHDMADLQERMRRAARRGVETWCKLRGVPFEPDMVEMTFDRLHTEPYAASPDIPPMQALRTAFEAMGMPWPAPTAWSSSCDARIYHRHGHPVAIFGAGKLEVCHGDTEYIDVPDLQRALAATTLATLAMTG